MEEITNSDIEETNRDLELLSFTFNQAEIQKWDCLSDRTRSRILSSFEREADLRDSAEALGLFENFFILEVVLTLDVVGIDDKCRLVLPTRYTVDQVKTFIFKKIPSLKLLSQNDYVLGISPQEKLSIEFIKFVRSSSIISRLISQQKIIPIHIYEKYDRIKSNKSRLSNRRSISAQRMPIIQPPKIPEITLKRNTKMATSHIDLGFMKTVTPLSPHNQRSEPPKPPRPLSTCFLSDDKLSKEKRVPGINLHGIHSGEIDSAATAKEEPVSVSTTKEVKLDEKKERKIKKKEKKEKKEKEKSVQKPSENDLKSKKKSIKKKPSKTLSENSTLQEGEESTRVTSNTSRIPKEKGYLPYRFSGNFPFISSANRDVHTNSIQNSQSVISISTSYPPPQYDWGEEKEKEKHKEKKKTKEKITERGRSKSVARQRHSSMFKFLTLLQPTHSNSQPSGLDLDLNSDSSYERSNHRSIYFGPTTTTATTTTYSSSPPSRTDPVSTIYSDNSRIHPHSDPAICRASLSPTLQRPVLQQKKSEIDAAMWTNYVTKEEELPDLVLKCDGFHIDQGSSHLWTQPPTSLEEEICIDDSLLDIPFYQDHFFGHDHRNWVGRSDQMGWIIVSILMEPDLMFRFAVIIWNRTKHERVWLEWNKSRHSLPSAKALIHEAKKKFAHLLEKSNLKRIKDEAFPERLLQLERTQIVGNFKFGVLYMKDGQIYEEEMFDNVETSEVFEEFLDLLGDRITLLGWPKYRGGLDVKYNTTGATSIYTDWESYGIMFHVSTLLPHYSDDKQQIERKRHLGNDIVCIIFVDGTTPYNPACISSEFNHVFIIVQPVRKLNDQTNQWEIRYRVATASKLGVSTFKPSIYENGLYLSGPLFRRFLLCKLVNGERASYRAPVFASKIKRTREQLMKTLIEPYLKK